MDVSALATTHVDMANKSPDAGSARPERWRSAIPGRLRPRDRLRPHPEQHLSPRLPDARLATQRFISIE